MNKLIENYLSKIDSDLYNLLKDYTVITFEKEKDIINGLLIYDKPPIGKAFLFKFKDEKIRSFHTVGMKFPITISFFTKDGSLIYVDTFSTGIKTINSKQPCKYVVEIPKEK